MKALSFRLMLIVAACMASNSLTGDPPSQTADELRDRVRAAIRHWRGVTSGIQQSPSGGQSQDGSSGNQPAGHTG